MVVETYAVEVGRHVEEQSLWWICASATTWKFVGSDREERTDAAVGLGLGSG